ncbi:unannotated protein [freshwater metagenome]|uniref:Unannotated protein n=1 Tax=freshwater metagenome TaxID=449393 RepID=A0A6J7D598_9ZZZZ
MNGCVEVLALDVIERLEVTGGRVSGLGTGDVESDHPVVAPRGGEHRDLEAAGRRAHGAEQHIHGEVGARGTAPEAVHHGLHHLVERQSGLGVQLWCAPHLGVHDTVRCEVLGTLEGHALDGVTVLHHPDGVGEGLEIQDEVVALGATMEPVGKCLHIGGGQVAVAVLGGQFDHGRGAQAAVQMVV